jgi:endothelin-converting enzyme
MKNIQLAALAACFFPTAISENLPPPPTVPPGQPSSGVLNTLSNPAVCATDNCKEIAKYLNKFLAPNYTTIDPCVDFDKYVCNGWSTEDNRTRHGFLALDMDENVQKLMRTTFENPWTEDDAKFSGNSTYAEKNFEKAKTVYAACMNETVIKAYGVTPLRKVLDELENFYPQNSTKGTNSSNDALTDALIYLSKMGDGGVFFPYIFVSLVYFLLVIFYFHNLTGV